MDISVQTIRRLPSYYNLLKELQRQGVETVSSPMIAREMNVGEIQVRKDLAAISASGGRPRTGFLVNELIECIEACLGYNNIDNAVLVGVGSLGRALLSYRGFEETGVHIIAAFDQDAQIIDTKVGGKQVFSMDKLPELCKRLNVHIGIITAPAGAAQSICDQMVQNGVLAVWNFAPTHLTVPDGVLLQNENMAISLSMLSQHLAQKMREEKTGKGELQ